MFAAVTLASLATANAGLYTPNAEILQSMWNQFKVEHGKSYSVKDESIKFATFVQNLKVIDERNKAENGTAFHAINRFTDISEEEFAARYLNAKPNPKTAQNVLDIQTPPTGSTLVDWTGTLTTPVKDQGYCGSCWAFSATEQIESDAIRQLKTTWLLSAEQITQCDKTSFGCDGGWTEHAYDYVTREGGLATESTYPYTSYQGVTGTCHSDKTKEVVGVTRYTTLKSESAMASYVETTGPLSVCVDASTWSSYSSGIKSTCTNSVNHCVQAVGVLATSSGYWKVRNSWGTSWGEAGYIRLSYGKNLCQIASDPTYVDVFKK